MQSFANCLVNSARNIANLGPSEPAETGDAQDINRLSKRVS
jgi:hypothetical protein